MEEEEEKLGFVLARASELKLKLNECIINLENNEENDQEEEEENEEDSTILKIRDAFESLEEQLSTLQVLQQQQRYERESSLSQIDRSRKILLNELTEYRGTANTDVIQEALSFAGGTLNRDYDDTDLFLPPYQNQLPNLFVALDQLSPSTRPTSKYPTFHNGKFSGSEEKLNHKTPERHEPRRIKQVVGFLAKSALMIIGVVSVLSTFGFRPTTINKKCCMGSKIQEMFQRNTRVDCPPGKIMVMEDGKQRCVVKERIEVPFDLNMSGPNINYGFG